MQIKEIMDTLMNLNLKKFSQLCNEQILSVQVHRLHLFIS